MTSPGNIRQLLSGRYQVSYLGPDGRRTGSETYERKGDAERALTLIGAKMISGEWTDPDRGKAEFKDYAETWISQRPGLPPRVRAAMIYQHAVRGADKTIRDAIDRHISVAGDGGDSPGLIVPAG